MGLVHRQGLVALLTRAAALCLVVLGLAGAGTPPATASCADDSGPVGSPVIFLGTADGERGGFTRFVVQEVWEGPDLASEVWVLSGQEQPPFPFNLFSAVGSSVDADFVDGQRYLVGADAEFQTNACRSREYSDVTDTESAPDDPRGPVTGGSEGADPPLGPAQQALLVGAVLTLLGGVGARWRRRRRRRREAG